MWRVDRCFFAGCSSSPGPGRNRIAVDATSFANFVTKRTAGSWKWTPHGTEEIQNLEIMIFRFQPWALGFFIFGAHRKSCQRNFLKLSDNWSTGIWSATPCLAFCLLTWPISWYNGFSVGGENRSRWPLWLRWPDLLVCAFLVGKPKIQWGEKMGCKKWVEISCSIDSFFQFDWLDWWYGISSESQSTRSLTWALRKGRKSWHLTFLHWAPCKS